MADVVSSLGQFLSESDNNKIVVLLGAGVELAAPLKDLQPPDVLHKAHKKAGFERSEEYFVWDTYEAIRWYTSHAPLPSMLFVVAQLMLAGRVAALVSLNYTRYIDAFIEKCRQLGTSVTFVRNPILEHNNEATKYDGYFASPNVEAVQYWKIHGDLGYASFACANQPDYPHVFKLPRFPVSNHIEWIVSNVRLNSPYRQWHDVLTSYDAAGHAIGGAPPHIHSALPKHHLDWCYPGERRAAFQREISGASTYLQDILGKSNRRLWILGFTGQYLDSSENPPSLASERSEELIPPVMERIKDDVHLAPRIWMSVYEEQFDRHFEAWFSQAPLLKELNGKTLEYESDWKRYAKRVYRSVFPDRGFKEEYASWTKYWHPGWEIP